MTGCNGGDSTAGGSVAGCGSTLSAGRDGSSRRRTAGGCPVTGCDRGNSAAGGVGGIRGSAAARDSIVGAGCGGASRRWTTKGGSVGACAGDDSKAEGAAGVTCSVFGRASSARRWTIGGRAKGNSASDDAGNASGSLGRRASAGDGNCGVSSRRCTIGGCGVGCGSAPVATGDMDGSTTEGAETCESASSSLRWTLGVCAGRGSAKGTAGVGGSVSPLAPAGDTGDGASTWRCTSGIAAETASSRPASSASDGPPAAGSLLSADSPPA